MVGVVALIVVGPEQLPSLARTAGRWIGKTRYLIHAVTAELNREMKTEELKKILEEQARLTEVDNLITETRQNFALAREALQIKPESNPVEFTPMPNPDAVKSDPNSESDPHE